MQTLVAVTDRIGTEYTKWLKANYGTSFPAKDTHLEQLRHKGFPLIAPSYITSSQMPLSYCLLPASSLCNI